MILNSSVYTQTAVPCDQSTAIAMAAVLAAYRSIAAAIVVVTASGKSAFQVAKFRPRCPIIGVTRYPIVARQMHLYRGIIPLIYEGLYVQSNLFTFIHPTPMIILTNC